MKYTQAIALTIAVSLLVPVISLAASAPDAPALVVGFYDGFLIDDLRGAAVPTVTVGSEFGEGLMTFDDWLQPISLGTEAARVNIPRKSVTVKVEGGSVELPAISRTFGSHAYKQTRTLQDGVWLYVIRLQVGDKVAYANHPVFVGLDLTSVYPLFRAGQISTRRAGPFNEGDEFDQSKTEFYFELFGGLAAIAAFPKTAEENGYRTFLYSPVTGMMKLNALQTGSRFNNRHQLPYLRTADSMILTKEILASPYVAVQERNPPGNDGPTAECYTTFTTLSGLFRQQ